MANYSTNFDGRTWPEIGVAFPAGYSYSDNEPPIEEYDDFITHNLIEDLKHLVELTNTRIESNRGTIRPSNPEDGHLFWDSDDGRLEVWDAGFGGWRQFAYGANATAHITATNNPHNVTAAQAVAIPDEPGAVTEAHLSFDTANQSELDAHTSRTDNPHNVTHTQAGAAPAVHTHDDRYYTESESNNRYYTKSQANNRYSQLGHTHAEVNGIRFTVGTSPPSNPDVGDVWFDTS